MVNIINGSVLAKKIRGQVAEDIGRLKKERGVSPKLCVVLVGDDPASQIYVRNKEKACAEVGIESEICRLPASIDEKNLINIVKKLNSDANIHGILVQLPLPDTISAINVLNEIAEVKDVDGLHPINMGKLLKGESPLFLPCTAEGIIELILSTGTEIRGKEAVVVGRSNIVGKPVALMLLQRHATVTICHSRTRDLGAVTKRANILVASVGSAGIVHGEMVKDGAIVIDVGMNRVAGKLTGDVDFESASEKAAYITPVPGGVGPMTIAMLMKNGYLAAKRAA
ncbi:bifunctional 5,10-methylene-tetrahydrofolate dehydrogenase/5,10-methylene-tetrahydrofolate cyclohydrolase [candidate division WOR-1 bacterium RIFCSPLOWO2_02_FULL_46_20]|uniref:Bifunctional protein FolD n=2 Tax=Saganbacteria TaxID=1703751 RepID=A0A1F4RFT9_UNCSA|nr:MAG: bifunctional 5,10-methylene-tetrahydrofolate dehydrogenase/5,10-methylene-tetrahydrofolate cyclohydrolase [candidate division WOR-1 bacterium RIFCSPHIGHO2_02_FULL_45_12]OGC06986.1 MAG: bifunctional 5,10-methylene-tetrahydrofolate dehydrogenase/5,10-methylene-tetrahydrofolate cyclohydrolase [candidate division WOR-1 bacterium RIFCSPLOWO2_02_FULL_46_20]OGC09510.1 MAG: bifunctional 5,10-methylene-tetrahydrofolate dehydrogenase/5,10-methylene-tetrahydrofolate cyclohydrolase [candidate divisio